MATLAEVLDALASGGLTARAYVDNLLARIHARDERVRAFVHLDERRAQALADACDSLRKGGATLGALHGLPVGVKDLFDTCDLPAESGCAAFAGNRPMEDAVIVERLKSAGAYVFGKTVTTELAYSHPAITRNPWNSLHTPGGSSAGSAAAVAAGFAHAAIGTQTNGSVIRPAAFCGVVGFKPTQGLLPAGGVRFFSPTLDQVGTFTRSVADAARFAAPLAEGDAIPPTILARERAPALGVLAEFPWTRLEPDAKEHFSATIKRLAVAGAQVQPITLPPAMDEANLVHRTIMLHEAARLNRDLQADHRDQLSAVLNEGLDEGRRTSQSTYGEMLARRAALIERVTDLFEGFDAIVCPPAPGGAPKRLDTTGDPGFCTLWSLVGVPAITLPSGLTDAGLPLGLQIVGRAGDDASLLATAQWVEGLFGPIGQPTRDT